MDNKDIIEIASDEILQYTKEHLKSEQDRRESIIQQSGRMQSAFSFIILALFTIAPLLLNYSEVYTNGKRVLSYYYFLTVFISISFFLLLSLLFATIAQRRNSELDYNDFNELLTFYDKNQSTLRSKDYRSLAMAKHYDALIIGLRHNNDKKVQFIVWSMRSFYISIGLCFLWTFVSVLIIAYYTINIGR